MTIQADLGSSLETFVSSLVASGRYSSENDVLREAVRLFQEREAKLVDLDAAIARGLADVAAGRVTPAAAAFEALDSKYQALADVQAQ
jgi:antitoxin ParD1/3/4